jgi:hypothetical protein
VLFQGHRCPPTAGRFLRLTQRNSARGVQLQEDLGHVMVVYMS